MLTDTAPAGTEYRPERETAKRERVAAMLAGWVIADLTASDDVTSVTQVPLDGRSTVMGG